MVRKKVTKKVVRKGAKKVARRRSAQSKVVSLKLKSADSMQLDAKKLGNSIGKVSALIVLIVSILAMSDKVRVWSILVDAVYGPFGYWPGMFWKGVVWGTVLGYIKGFVIGWLIAKIYNRSSGCILLRK